MKRCSDAVAKETETGAEVVENIPGGGRFSAAEGLFADAREAGPCCGGI